MNNAETHAWIASKVYNFPLVDAHDDNYETRVYVETDGTCRINSGQRFDDDALFDLLETEDGNPTQQAKASAFDVLMWMLRGIWFKQQQAYLTHRQLILLVKTLVQNNCSYYCEAIYKAAAEAIRNIHAPIQLEADGTHV